MFCESGVGKQVANSRASAYLPLALALARRRTTSRRLTPLTSSRLELVTILLCLVHSVPSDTPTLGPNMARGWYIPRGLMNRFLSATMALMASGSQVTMLLVWGREETTEMRSELKAEKSECLYRQVYCSPMLK